MRNASRFVRLIAFILGRMNPNLRRSTQLYIDPVNCIDCGACVPVCPTNAIYAEADVPENFAAFTEKNAQYYQ